MAQVKTGNELALAILKALGIDSRMVFSVVLSMKPDEIATVTVVRHVDGDEADRIAAELTQYDIERKADPVALSGQTNKG